MHFQNITKGRKQFYSNYTLISKTANTKLRRTWRPA